MEIPEFVSQKFKQAFGPEATEFIVTWMQGADSSRADIAELCHEMQVGFARLEARLETAIERSKADLMKWSFVFWVGAVISIALLATLPIAAQTPVRASGDTIVLIVKSPRGTEVSFSGTIVLRDAKTTRRFDNVKTPFELRLPAQDIDARFVADDGAGLSGEIVAFRGGEKGGQAWGTMYRGPLLPYFAPGQGFGIGNRNAAKRVVP